MARYVFIKATDTIGNLESASPQTSDTLGDMPNDSLAIGYGNEVAGGLQYNQILQISTAVEKLLNSSRDRGYPLTGVSLHHYSVATAGTNRDQDGAVNPVSLLWGITDRSNNTNVTGEVSLRIGLDFPFPGAGAGAVGDRTPYSSQIVDRCARLALRFLVDWYLKVNETGIGTQPPSWIIVGITDAAMVGPETPGGPWEAVDNPGSTVSGGVITLVANFGAVQNVTVTGLVPSTGPYRITMVGGAPDGPVSIQLSNTTAVPDMDVGVNVTEIISSGTVVSPEIIKFSNPSGSIVTFPAGSLLIEYIGP